MREYVNDKLQLRPLLQSRTACSILIGLLVFLLVAELALIYGRPESADYWDDLVGDDALGDFLGNLSVCERVRPNDFVRLPVNASSSLFIGAAGLFCLTLFVIDIQKENVLVADSDERAKASILLRQPLWSLSIGLTFVYVGTAQFLFFASTLSTARTIYDASRWSAIVVLVSCAIARMLDSPEPITTKCGKYKGILITGTFLLVHLGLTVGLVYRLDLLEQGGLPDLVSYGLIVVGVVASIIHWRFHALSISSQPILLFVAGAMALLAAGATFYDSPGSEYCDPLSIFQFEALYGVLIAGAALLIYLYLRSDVWTDAQGTTVRTPMDDYLAREGQRARPPPPRTQAPAGQGDGGRIPEAPRQTRLISNSSQVSMDGEIVRRPTTTAQGRLTGSSAMERLRLTTESVMNSRVITPENGFTALQIRIAELIIGGLLCGAVIAVIAILFSGAL